MYLKVFKEHIFFYQYEKRKQCQIKNVHIRCMMTILFTCRSITRSYYRNSVGILIVFDITKRKSFENITQWLKESKDQTEPHKGVYLIVGHKSDRDEERQVTTREGKMFAESNGLKYIETSARNGQNVEEAFLLLAREIHKLIQDDKLHVEDGWDGVKHGFSRPPKEPFHVVEGEPEGSGCC